MINLLEKQIWNNSGLDYFLALGIFFGLWIVFYVFIKFFLHKLRGIFQKTKNDLDDYLITLLSGIKAPFYFFVSFYVASRFLVMSDIVSKIIFGFFVFALVLQIILFSQSLIDYIIKKRLLKEDVEDSDKNAVIRLAGKIAKGMIWIFGLLMILSNLGVNITSLVTGLGVGGVAVAFALQNILADIFASFSIFTDKPFKVGDFIVVGQDSGVVEKIGIKTTRIKTLEGQELVIPNKILTEDRVNNYGKMEERRVVFSFGVVYGTEFEKIKKIPRIVEEAINKQKDTVFDRAHFDNFGESSLDFEIVYYIKSSDFKEYKDIQQDINLEVLDRFRKENIEFALPSRTVYLEK